jgi:hypothetical protein
MKTVLKPILGALLAVSCAGEPDLTDRVPPDATIVLPGMDAELNEAGGEPCPPGEPKVGDRCPPGFSEGNSCTYVVDSCTGPNGEAFLDTLDYCCLGTLWAMCGGLYRCEGVEAGAAPDRPVDAPVTGDGGSDAPCPDGGVFDASPDDAAQDAAPQG